VANVGPFITVYENAITVDALIGASLDNSGTGDGDGGSEDGNGVSGGGGGGEGCFISTTAAL